MSKHKEGKPRETRPGATWHMDMIVFRHKSLEGCKYLIVLTDEATDFKQLLSLARKSDATREVRRWIDKMRAHPAFYKSPYQMISRILTDNAGEWSEECKDFNSVMDKRGVEVIWGDPQDHARDAAVAEGANKIVEAGIQSTLYQNNLPPTWWQRAADDVQFLVNRFPAYSHDPNTPSDGDTASPIELMYNEWYSRNQVRRELNSYISVGTPALCHQRKVKGSHLEPKVRWGIAVGRRGKVTSFMCPFNRSVSARFKTRSFTAHILREGLNWSQFLGLGNIGTEETSRMMPQKDKKIMINLPEERTVEPDVPPPIKEMVKVTTDKPTTRFKTDHKPGQTKHSYTPVVEQFDPIKELDDKESNDSDAESDDEDKGRKLNVTVTGVNIEIDPDKLPRPDRRGLTNHIDGLKAENIGSESEASVEPYEAEPTPKQTRAQTEKDDQLKAKREKRQKVKDLEAEMNSILDNDVFLEADDVSSADLQTMEDLESKRMRKYRIKTDGRMRFVAICKAMNSGCRERGHPDVLPAKYQNVYRLWLLTKPKRHDETMIAAVDLPKSVIHGRDPLKADLICPYPSGPHWDYLLSNPKSFS